MNTIDHGMWNAYTPATMPEGAPMNAMFARRASDGMDWYQFVEGVPFGAGHVIIAASWRDPLSAYVVGPATYDPTTIFPANCIVHEVTDYTGSDPQTDLGSKVFDPATGLFTDPVYPPEVRAADDPIMQALQVIMTRLDALERK